MARKVLGVTGERVYKDPCVIKKFQEIEEKGSHDGMVGRVFWRYSDSFVKGVNFFCHGRLDSGLAVKAHWHEMVEYWYFLSGQGTLINTDSSKIIVGPGDGLYVAPNAIHEVRADIGSEPLKFLVLGTNLPGIPYRHGFFEPVESITSTGDSYYPPAVPESENFENVLGVCCETLSDENHIIRNKDFVGQFKTQGDLRMAFLYSREDDFVKSLVHLGVGTLDPGMETIPHWHDYVECWYVTKGTGALLDCDGSERAIEAGDAVYITPNGIHALRSDKKSALEFVAFACEIPGVPYRGREFVKMER